MKSSNPLKVIIAGYMLFSFPVNGLTQNVINDDVKTSVQPLQIGEFQLHFKFDLPNFGAPSEKINIDYAVLQFEMRVVSLSTTATNMIEVQVASENKRDPLPGLEFNVNPVTAELSRNRIGNTTVKMDITQIINLWIHGNVANHGLLLISHRGLANRIFHPGNVVLAENRTPLVNIYYTILDD